MFFIRLIEAVWSTSFFRHDKRGKRAFTAFTFQSRDRFCTTKAMAKLTLILDSYPVYLTSAKQPNTRAA
jgi:hypothetical protein